MKSLLIMLAGVLLISGTKPGRNAYTKNENHHKTDTLVPIGSQANGLIEKSRINAHVSGKQVYSPATELKKWDFSNGVYGDIPQGWTDLLYRRPSRNWLIDGEGYLRHVLKNRNNRLTYEPFSNSFLESPTTPNRPGLIALASKNLPVNVRIKSRFKKTQDSEVFFAVAGRIKDPETFYTVMVTGDEKLVLGKVEKGEMKTLTELVLLRRYQYPEVWELTAAFQDDLITGIVTDTRGSVVARLDARDGEFTGGSYGLYCTDYAAAASFSLLVPVEAGKETPVIAWEKPALPTAYEGYSLIQPVSDPAAVPTAFENTTTNYDIIVAGAGTAGWAAAVQAARMGKSVLLLEETDWIGGQMSAAAVTSMDESGPLVRERGIYREFHESMVAYYYGKDKCPFVAYFWGRQSQNQQEGGFEPKISRDVLYGFILDARAKAKQNGKNGRLDLLLRTKVTGLLRNGNTITGADVQQWNEGNQHKQKKITAKLVVDATEYGDVIPLTRAPYRVGNTKSEKIDMDGAVQHHTFCAVMREYPDGVPDHLVIAGKPPRYEEYIKVMRNRKLYGDWLLVKDTQKKQAKGEKSLMYRAWLAWRGMADTESPLVGKVSQFRHTLMGLNTGNDYPTSVATIESEDKRMEDEREGIYRTLAQIYYLQHELGLPWSVAEDQGYNTAYNREMMKKRGIPDSFMNIVKHMPQMPYVRESRRLEGKVMIVTKDMDRWEKAKHVATSVAVGDYFMDLHGTKEFYERDLDDANFAHMGGPFQLPFEAFIPREIDGFIPAEKNFSQSRIVSGSTRLQPITMLTGQAVGVIAAMAIEKGVQPRKLDPLTVQYQLLESGAALIPRWYSDVQWGTPTWKALQFLSLYKILDKRGDLEYWDGMEFAPKTSWGVDTKLTGKEAAEGLSKLAEIMGYKGRAVAGDGQTVSFSQLQKMAGSINASFGSLFNGSNYKEASALTHETFALVCLDIIKKRS